VLTDEINKVYQDYDYSQHRIAELERNDFALQKEKTALREELVVLQERAA
jgi:hypothetical protein